MFKILRADPLTHGILESIYNNKTRKEDITKSHVLWHFLCRVTDLTWITKLLSFPSTKTG